MEIITGFRGGGIRITDIKAVQAGFLVPLQDTLMVYLSYSEVGPVCGQRKWDKVGL